MTDEERKQIVSDVLAALKQNSTTIDQMLEKENCADDDFFETNKGNKISFKTLSKGYNEEQGAVGDAIRYQFKRSDGKKLYPQTSSACVTMSDGNDSLDTRVKNITTEYNVSLFHPKQGIDGSNKYTLSSAIALVPEKYRSIGIKCSFVGEDGLGETWEYKGEVWRVDCFYQVGVSRLVNTEAKTNTCGYNTISYNLVNNNILISTILGDKITETTFNEWGSLKMPCIPGEFFYISCLGGQNGRGYAFVDSNNTVIECADSFEFVQRIIFAPKNAVLLVVNNAYPASKNPYPCVIKLSYKSIGNGFINLAWYAGSAPTYIKIGEIGYNTSTKLLRVKISDSEFKTVYFEKNALYYYCGATYRYIDGELQRVDIVDLKQYTNRSPVVVSDLQQGDIIYSVNKGLLYKVESDSGVTIVNYSANTFYKYKDKYHIWEPNTDRLIPFDFSGNVNLKKFAPLFTGEGLSFGDVCYNTGTKLLRRYIGEEDDASVFETLPFVDGAIYTYNGNQYFYDKDRLVQYVYAKPTNVVGLYLPHKKVLLSAGSLSQYNGYFEYAMKYLGLDGTNISVAGKNIMDLAHTLYTNGSYKSVDLTDIDVLIFSHVHNFDVYSLPTKLENYKPSNYENDEIISPYIKTDTYTSGNLVGNDTYTADELYAIGYDYCIKKWKELCYNLKGTNGYDTKLGKPAQMIMYTYWHDARVTFNTAIRRLSEKWCISLIKDDENIGFSKEKVNPITGTQESLLHCNGYPWGATEVIDGVTYGFHPSGIPESVGWENFLAMDANEMLKNMPYIQVKRASILINSLRNAIVY